MSKLRYSQGIGVGLAPMCFGHFAGYSFCRVAPKLKALTKVEVWVWFRVLSLQRPSPNQGSLVSVFSGFPLKVFLQSAPFFLDDSGP